MGSALPRKKSWWKNESKATSVLTEEIFRKFYECQPPLEPYYHAVHPDHDKHKMKVRILCGLDKTPSKKNCPLCSRFTAEQGEAPKEKVVDRKTRLS